LSHVQSFLFILSIIFLPSALHRVQGHRKKILKSRFCGLLRPPNVKDFVKISIDFFFTINTFFVGEVKTLGSNLTTAFVFNILIFFYFLVSAKNGEHKPPADALANVLRSSTGLRDNNVNRATLDRPKLNGSKTTSNAKSSPVDFNQELFNTLRKVRKKITDDGPDNQINGHQNMLVFF